MADNARHMVRRPPAARVVVYLVLLTVTGCLHRPVLNEHGLEVISRIEVYDRSVELDRRNQLVEIQQFVPDIVLDLRYATANNFAKRQFYGVGAAFVRFPAAIALFSVQAELREQGLGLKVYDAYRPYSVTRQMWELYKDPSYVADPSKGSRHNRGAAVDVTLVSLATGEELTMPTSFDEFSPRASHSFEDIPLEAKRNRDLLRRVMTDHGFEALESEWWHYDFRHWQQFPLLDIAVEELAAAM